MNRRVEKTCVHRKGFAFFIAIGSIVFVAMAAMAVMNQFNTAARRTQTEAIDAQLRQLVRAGAIEAKNVTKQEQLQFPQLAAMVEIKPIDQNRFEITARQTSKSHPKQFSIKIKKNIAADESR